ncbi:hypothetical protein BB558_003516 [Smittium angustum]|uniref:Oxidoreductase n=1 Tax=Smittium angustum TaxID=133377 RepID=A0A2U1J5R3_SMIAN|nr:hypothetical protein BB558_003516 [Smittium angustum]
MDQKQVLNVGLVGFGFAARVFHCPLITNCSGLNLSAVLERNASASQSVYPSVQIVRTIDELVGIPSLDLIVITSVNSTHFEYAKTALMAGKHCVVEKPFTITSKEAEELSEIAKQKNLILSCYQNRRFDGDFLTIKQIIEGNMLGKIVELESRFDRYRIEPKPSASPNKYAWRENADEPGGGILFDLGPHLIDQVICLFGKPESVTAHIEKQRPIEHSSDDSFTLTLHYPKINFNAVCRASMVTKIKPPRFTIFGLHGTFIKNGLDVQESQLIDGKTPKSTGFGIDSNENWGQIDTTMYNGENGIHFVGKIETIKGNYSAYYENVRDAILGKSQLLITSEQAALTIKIIEKAFESSEKKITVMI